MGRDLIGTNLTEPAVAREKIRVLGRPGLDDRPPLPAGHADSWGAIVAGTALADADYPYPVFNDHPRRRG